MNGDYFEAMNETEETTNCYNELQLSNCSANLSIAHQLEEICNIHYGESDSMKNQIIMGNPIYNHKN